jgi:Tfp pilus assembly protein PilN
MRSIGIVFKKNEMLMVAVRYGIRRFFLEGYRILPFVDCSEEEKEAVILHNLERFLNDYRGTRSNIFAALPRSDAFVHYVHLPLAAEDDLRTAIGYDIDRHSPFGSDDVYYDCHIVRRMPESGQLYVLLVIVQRARVDALIELFKKLKIKLHGIELTTTALVNGYAPAPEAESGFDLTALMHNGQFQKVLRPLARRFPVLEKCLTVQSDVQALDGPIPIVVPVEYLDSEYYELDVIADGALHYSRVFACQTREPGEAQLQDMLRHGRQACIHLPFDQIDERPLRFILSGREMDRDFPSGIPAELSEQFSAVSSVSLHLDIPQEESSVDVSSLLFVPANLALKGLKPVGLDINLIPPELRPRRRKSKRKLLIVAAACLVVGLIAALALRWDMARSMEQQKSAVTLSKLSREYKSVEARRENFARIEKLYQTAMLIDSSDVGKLNILLELTEIIPEDAWLTEFNYRADTRGVKLSGYALSASQLLPVLEQSELFENVRFTSPITTDRRSQKEQFRMEMQLKLAGKEAQ